MDTNYWICDTCGERITKAEDGWVEWIILKDKSGGHRRKRDMRLVHHFPSSPRKQGEGCQFNQKAEFAKDQGIIGDLSLQDFLGPKGLMTLLSFIAEEGVANSGVLEMIKRLHIPGYEIARFHMEEAVRSGAVETNTYPGYPSPREIKEILKYAEEKGLE